MRNEDRELAGEAYRHNFTIPPDELSAKIEDSSLWKLDTELLACLMSQYEKTFDAIIEQGVVRAQGDYVIARGITLEQIKRVTEGDNAIIMLDGEGTDIRQAAVFEIVAVGEGCPDTLRKGDHMIPIRTGIDPFRADRKTSYVNVHKNDIVATWEPKFAAEKLLESQNSVFNLRRKANGVG